MTGGVGVTEETDGVAEELLCWLGLWSRGGGGLCCGFTDRLPAPMT